MPAFTSNIKQLLQEFVESTQALNLHLSVKNVHQLRILSRRLRAALWILIETHPQKDFLKIQKRMQDLGKKLGKVREIDVLIEDAATYNLDGKKLQQRRVKAGKNLQNHLNTKLQEQFEEDFLLLMIYLDSTPFTEEHRLLNKIRRETKKWPTTLPKKKRRQHQIRIKTKKAIYRLEILNQKAPKLRLLQRNLGRAHDLEFLQKTLGPKKSVEQDATKFRKKAKSIYRKLSVH